jgi:hypothetical protein
MNCSLAAREPVEEGQKARHFPQLFGVIAMIEI